jgi:hypothetical protein
LSAPTPRSRRRLTKPKDPSNKADFDAAAVLRQIALDVTAPATARVSAARVLLLHEKAAKPAAEAAQREAASPINKAALRLVTNRRRG